MPDKKITQQGLILQRTTKIIDKLKSKKIGQERFIKTSYGEVRVLEYGFDSNQVKPLYIDLHAGGFIMHTADMDETINIYLQEKCNIKIVSIDYPKAPRNPYPIAIEVTYEIIKHYINNSNEYKINSSRIGIGGQSAGGNLAAVICLLAKKKKDVFFNFQILNFPYLDLLTKPHEKKSTRKALPPKLIEIFNMCYFNDNFEVAKSAYLSPVKAAKKQLLNLPPALIIVAGYDSLRDEGIEYAKMLKDANVKVELHDFEKSPHSFTYKNKKDAKEALDLMCDFINRNI